MFKRFSCIVLLFCCLFSCASADVRYVRGGKLNLREQPDKGAASLGLYYTGTRIQVLEEMENWCRVRIATGESDAPVEGYMMSQFLTETAWFGVCDMPYGTWNGKPGYVLSQGKNRLHVLYEDGTAGYVPQSNTTLPPPQLQEKLLMERICTAEDGAVITNSAGEPIATLYGGVVLDGSLIFAGRTCALVGLNDEKDEARGLLTAGWTWMDNGANCSVQYDVYESENGLIEVLGTTADGRTILRLTTNGIDTPQVALVHDFIADGLAPLQREGSYFRYMQSLMDEPEDDTLLQTVYAQLSPEVLSSLAGCTAQVERVMDFQYRHRMLRVVFTDADGQFAGAAEYDNGRILWMSEDNG